MLRNYARFTEMLKGRSALIAILLVVTHTVISIGAESDDLRRKQLITPGIVINSDVPYARTNVLLYHRGFLYAAGDDQVVRRWQVTDGQIKAESLRTYRWPIWREQRGKIKALAISPDGKRMAIAGKGIFDDVIHELNLATGKVTCTTASLAATVCLGSDIECLAYNKAGQLFAGAQNGGVGSFVNPRTSKWKVLRQGKSVEVGGAIIGLLPKQDVCVAMMRNGQLLDIPLDPSRPISETSLLGSDFFAGAAHISDRPSGRILLNVTSATATGEIRLLDLPSRNVIGSKQYATGTNALGVPARVVLSESGNSFALLTSYSEKGRVFHHLPSTRLFVGKSSELHMASQPIWSFPTAPNACCFISDKYVAVATGPPFQIQIVDVTQKKAVSQISQASKAIYGVSFREDGNTFLWQTSPVTNDRSLKNLSTGMIRGFTPKRRKINTFPDNAPFPRATIQRSGWTVVPLSQGDLAHEFEIVHQSGAKHRIKLDFILDGEYEAVTFLPPKANGVQRIAVAHNWGASIYEFSQSMSPRRVKHFVGHQGKTLSVACNKQGTMLLTGGADGTICCFSLADWETHPNNGVSLRKFGAAVVVDEVEPGSPGWAAKLAPGDRILGAYYDGDPVAVDRFFDVYTKEVKDGLVAKTILKPSNEIAFDLLRGGKKLEVKFTGRQRPLWKFRAVDKEWIWWRWRDYFYDCSTEGDKLIGWQINDGYSGTPRFLQAEQVRSKYYRPHVMEELYQQAKFEPERVQVADLVPPNVRVEVKKAPGGYRVICGLANQDEVALCGEPRELSVWIGDYRAAQWINPGLGEKSVYLKSSDLRPGLNRVVARAVTSAGVRGDSPDSQLTTVEGLPATRRKLFVFAIGIDDYENVRINALKAGVRIGDLTGAVNDAKGILQVTKKQFAKAAPLKQNSQFNQDPGFTDFGEIVLTNEDATRKRIFDEFEKLKTTLGPNDQLLFFFGGHGEADRNRNVEDRVVFDPNSLTLITFDARYGDFYRTGIPFSRPLHTKAVTSRLTLFDAISELKCRKIVVLDACHSGGGTEMIRHMTPDLVSGPTVMVAAQANESALPYGRHGLFTRSLLSTLTSDFEKADNNQNGWLTPREIEVKATDKAKLLWDAVQGNLPDYLRGVPQTPAFWTPESDRDRNLFRRGGLKMPFIQ